ncbi:ABC transporter permease [Pseudoalteromonas sp. T1lg24]|uniref:ABC transporter permease n=1 Tax=Pseudoalteromonas sp. T1lg24 TaxID=2077099 RepID=UPI000CF6DE4C|nr:ABC transporter permease [Pseudoalteromonas sp. T1lg24]
MIKASIIKEFRLIFSDLHSLAVLFLMPISFMLIMTFALSNKAEDLTKSINLNITQQDSNLAESLLKAYLSDVGFSQDINQQADVTLELATGFESALFADQANSVITFSHATSLSPQMTSLAKQHLQIALAKVKLHIYLLDAGQLSESMPLAEQMSRVSEQTNQLKLVSFKREENYQAVQHSIPSWLVFGVFFIVLPISITLISESQNGTLLRVTTFPISNTAYFSAKLLAFYLVSFTQAIVLMIIGFTVIPKLVDAPSLNVLQLVPALPLLAVTCATAVTFGAVIASQIKSHEQAIVIGGGTNILLAAISGLMVPLDIMPKAMQTIAQLSPMHWAQSGLKNLFISDSDVLSLTTALPLIIFSVICGVLALWLFELKVRKLQWK